MKMVECQCDQRREQVRAKPGLNGLDYLEVRGAELKVFFLGKAPRHLTRDNFRIEGGRRVRDIKVEDVEVIRNPDEKLDDFVRLKLDRDGDFSLYTLRLIHVKEPIDPFYDHLDFTFKIDCPSDLDCKAQVACQPTVLQDPEINYLTKDYAGFRQLILDRLAATMPDWRERHTPDIGVALVETLAYTGDHLSYYQDAVATEAYLDTARKRISVRRHARLVDYRMHEGCNARAWVCIQVTGNLTLDPTDMMFVAGLTDVLKSDRRTIGFDELRELPPLSFLAYQPLVADGSKRLKLYESHNRISFYTWGLRGCCLPRGATNATLRDEWIENDVGQPEQQAPRTNKEEMKYPLAILDRPRNLRLEANGILIFEEVLGPKTGDPADADPAHRHAVRLTKVEPGIDPLDDTPVVEIEWAPEDALPFPLCISALTDADHGCIYHADVSIASGNVVLADHGMTLEPEDPDPNQAPIASTQAECLCEGVLGDVSPVPGRYRPKLSKASITCGQPVDFDASASKIMRQDPHEALPLVKLTSCMESGSKVVHEDWNLRFDLLQSSGNDNHFVIEIDNDGRAHLRFGDGDCGRMPQAGMRFSAQYRVGNGTAGNVGQEAISQLAYRNEKPDGIECIRNPLPAIGGQDPEPITEVKLLAPSTFRNQLMRAVTADDHARIAERNPKVQRAGAMLRWNGIWHEVQVAIDPVGSQPASEALLKEIEADLYPFRRIGYDLRVVPAQYVSLDIAMNICVKPEYLRGHVKAALIELFRNGVMRNAKRGFFHPDNLTFGKGIFTSRLIEAALAVEGVESAYVTRLLRQFERPNQEIENGVLPLGPLEIARCDNDPNFPEHGRFELKLQGGR